MEAPGDVQYHGYLEAVTYVWPQRGWAVPGMGWGRVRGAGGLICKHVLLAGELKRSGSVHITAPTTWGHTSSVTSRTSLRLPMSNTVSW